jgi:hypothetical protein
MPLGELRKLKDLAEAMLAERATEARQLYAERLAALREELGMPERAPVKRRAKKKATRDTNADKTGTDTPLSNGAHP